MQKARRHRESSPLRPLVGVWFQVLFHPGTPGTFHLSLTVLCAIGLLNVFSLAGWCRLIQRRLLRPPPTQDTLTPWLTDCYGTLTPSGRLSQSVRIHKPKFNRKSFNPSLAVTKLVWALPRSLATTGGITFVFSSCGYLDVSVHRVRPLPTGRVTARQAAGLPHSDTLGSAPASGSPKRFVACHVLPRPQKPQASPRRPFAACSHALMPILYCFSFDQPASVHLAPLRCYEPGKASLPRPAARCVVT